MSLEQKIDDLRTKLENIVYSITYDLNGIVDVFSYAVWTYTFLDLTEQIELSARETEFFEDNIPVVEDHQYKGHKNLGKPPKA